MYYVSIQDAVHGPYSVEDLGQMLAEGTITPRTMAVLEGQENWMSLESIIHIEHVHGDGSHVSKRVKQGKECPFCGGTKIRAASKEFFSTGFDRVFSPKLCKHCDAIWTPRVELSTAFLIFAIGLIGFISTAIIIGPEISYHIGTRDTRPAPIGPHPAINWTLGIILILISFTAVRKSLRYLSSPKVRSFRILRHPHRQLHG